MTESVATKASTELPAAMHPIATANNKTSRRSLEDRLAEIRAEERKVIEQIRRRDKEARAQFEKDLWALLKSSKLDDAPIEAWRDAVPAIAKALRITPA